MAVWRSRPPRRVLEILAHTLAFSFPSMAAKYPQVIENARRRPALASTQPPASFLSKSQKFTFKGSEKSRSQNQKEPQSTQSRKSLLKLGGRETLLNPVLFHLGILCFSISRGDVSTRNEVPLGNTFWKIKCQALQKQSKGFASDAVGDKQRLGAE